MITWIAEYNDGTLLTKQGAKLNQERLDRTKLKSFRLMHNDRLLINCEFKSGQYFQYRVRNKLTVGATKPDRVHIIVRRNDSDQTVIFVYETDLSIHVTNGYGGGPLQHELFDDPSESTPIGDPS